MKNLILLLLAFPLLVSAQTPTLINNGKLQSHLNLNGLRATNGAAPSLSTDYATKGYVDSTAGGVGTVTSVGASVPSWLTVSGSPVTSSGTLAISATTGQTANRFLATPDGTTGIVGLRAIVADDVPTLPWAKVSKTGSSLADLDTRSAGDLSSGTLAAARFGTITTTADGGSHSLKVKNYIVLAFPHLCDGAGAIIATNDNTQKFFGQALFSGTAATNANFVEYRLTVPEDIDTAVDLKVERWKIRLSNTDTSAHKYNIAMASVADSAGYDSPTLGQWVAIDIGADASGASGDVETVSNVTLTDWKSNVTAGRLWVIRVNRDGANDTSTVAAYSGPLVISYGSTQ